MQSHHTIALRHRPQHRATRSECRALGLLIHPKASDSTQLAFLLDLVTGVQNVSDGRRFGLRLLDGIPMICPALRERPPVLAAVDLADALLVKSLVCRQGD